MKHTRCPSVFRRVHLLAVAFIASGSLLLLTQHTTLQAGVTGSDEFYAIEAVAPKAKKGGFLYVMISLRHGGTGKLGSLTLTLENTETLYLVKAPEQVALAKKYRELLQTSQIYGLPEPDMDLYFPYVATSAPCARSNAASSDVLCDDLNYHKLEEGDDIFFIVTFQVPTDETVQCGGEGKELSFQVNAMARTENGEEVTAASAKLGTDVEC